MRASIDARRRRRGDGFTLVELLLALGIIGIIFSTLIYMRLEAMERVTAVIEDRSLRRLAQEKLEENIARCMSNELEELAGEFPDRPGWFWEWREEVNREGEDVLLSFTIVITYPDPNAPDRGGDREEKTYELTAWVLPTDEQREFILEQEQLMLEGGSMGIDGYYGTGM
ncbi:MAG TPA: hypothetical protein DCM87_09125 [Planctomycetes bacterium]|nr:hypothetical protein [Planctomycetota bacterium]